MTTERKRILLVEDEPHLAFHLEFNLQAEGYDVTPAQNGAIALEKYKKGGPFDLIILDVMVPEVNGFDVAKTIRLKDSQTGILMLTARAGEEDRIKGLESGVDDYITKPFHLKELLLRVKRMLKRSELFQNTDATVTNQQTLRCGVLELNTEALMLKGPNGPYSLTALEADILGEFMRNPSRVLTREHLLAKVWGMNGKVETRTVDNFIMRLRRYIESDPTAPKFLESVRGRGYRLNDLTANKSEANVPEL